MLLDYYWIFSLGTMTYAGAQFGTVISYPISGVLIEAAGWRSVFYTFGVGAIVWSSMFFFFGSDSPAASANKTLCGIPDSERKFIENGLGIHQDEATVQEKSVNIDLYS